MHFTKIIVNNFQGLKGTHAFDLTVKPTVFVGKNGTGKTSLINAVKYVLTGTEPVGQIMTAGETKMHVTIFADGHAYTRGKTEKGNCWFIDKKAVNLTTFNNAISGSLSASVTKPLVSSEVISGFSPKEFSDFLFTFANSIPKDELYAAIGDDILTDGVRMILDDHFRSDTVTTADINALYKAEKSRRTALSKSISEKEGQQKALSRNGLKPAMHTKEELKEMYVKAKEDVKKAAGSKAKMKAYEDAVRSRKNQEAMLQTLKRDIDSITIPEWDSSKREKAEKDYESAQAKRDASLKAAASYKSLIDSLEKSIKNLDTQICPLSKKLLCTTDKSGIKKELEETVNNTKTALLQAEGDIKDAQKAIDDSLSLIKEAEKIKALIDKKANLEKQKASLEASLVAVPEKPELLDMESAEKKMEEVNAEINDYKNYEQYSLISREYVKEKQAFDDVTTVLKLFEAKGPVKKKLTENIINQLSSLCKTTADSLGGMDIGFEAVEAGIVFTVKDEETGVSLDFKSLSGGEKAKVMFVIMSALCELSGFRVMLMDELSVLDREGLETLADILKEKADDFDLVIINAVDHEDTVSVFSSVFSEVNTMVKEV